jgi:PST family polysaccharide transporter/lipopolysaccharide exporter
VGPIARWIRALWDRTTPSGSVTDRAVQSGAWATLSNVLGRGLQLVKLVVLANLLSPEEFGLIGIALLTLAAIRRVTKLGIDEALIQRPETDVDEYLDTAWVLRSGRGIAIAAVVVAGAPVVADVFDVPAATDVIRVMALVPLLRGVQNPGIVYFRKSLEFHKEFVYQVGRAFADASVAVAAALVLGNVWALVFGALAGVLARLSLSYLVHEYRPGLAFDRKRAREMLGFGKWITLSGALVFLINEGDDAFVGWFLSAGALGLYQVAYRLSNAPATEISHVISSVIFPTYAQLQDDESSLRRAYFRTLQLTTFVAVPSAVGIAVVAPTFVPAVLGPAWTDAVPVMQLLAVWGLMRALGATTGPLFRSVGRPDIESKIQLGKLLIIAAFIYPTITAAVPTIPYAAVAG